MTTARNLSCSIGPQLASQLHTAKIEDLHMQSAKLQGAVTRKTVTLKRHGVNLDRLPFNWSTMRKLSCYLDQAVQSAIYHVEGTIIRPHPTNSFNVLWHRASMSSCVVNSALIFPAVTARS